MNSIASEKMNKITVKQGDNLFNQEDIAESMFVCIEGLLSTEVDGIEVGQTKAYSIRAGQHLEGRSFRQPMERIFSNSRNDSLVLKSCAEISILLSLVIRNSKNT